jgi:hypothetical protein
MHGLLIPYISHGTIVTRYSEVVRWVGAIVCPRRFQLTSTKAITRPLGSASFPPRAGRSTECGIAISPFLESRRRKQPLEERYTLRIDDLHMDPRDLHYLPLLTFRGALI